MSKHTDIDTVSWRTPPKGKLRIIEFNNLDGRERVIGDSSTLEAATKCAEETMKDWFGSEKRTKEVHIYDDTGDRRFDFEPRNSDLIPVINL